MTTRTQRPKRQSRAPLGLQAIFSAMQPAAFRKVHGATPPDNFWKVYKAIDKTNQEDDPQAFSDALKEAAVREFGFGFGPDAKESASENADVAILAGFWAGVATAWHYMNAINGKDGAL